MTLGRADILYDRFHLLPLASSLYSFKKSSIGTSISPKKCGVVLDRRDGIAEMPCVAIVVEGGGLVGSSGKGSERQE